MSQEEEKNKVTRDYSADNIKSVTWYEAIQCRPAMYIGGVKMRGLSNLIKGSIDDGSDRLKSDFISIELKENLKGKLFFKNIKESIKDEMPCPIRGIHGFFIPVLNAVSSFFDIKIYGEFNDLLNHQIYEKGQLIKGEIQKIKLTGQRVEIYFELDKEIWREIDDWHISYILDELQNYTFLNREKTIEIKYKVQEIPCTSVFKYEKGLWDKIEIKKLKSSGTTYFDTWIETDIDDFFIEIAFAFREYTVDEPYLISFVNGFHSHENGTHVDGVLLGLKKGILKYLELENKFDIEELNEIEIKKNLLLAINIRLKNPKYTGSVKNKITNPEIIEPLAKYISELFFEQLKNENEASEKLIWNLKYFRDYKS